MGSLDLNSLPVSAANPKVVTSVAEAPDAKRPRCGLAQRRIHPPGHTVGKRRVERVHDFHCHHETGGVVGERARQHRRPVVAERIEAEAERRHRREDAAEPVGAQRLLVDAIAPTTPGR